MSTQAEIYLAGEKRRKHIEDLRSFIDWLEVHEGVPIPFDLQRIHLYPHELDAFSEIARQMGTFEKEMDETLYTLVKRFGSIEFRVVKWRETVCKRRQVGTVKKMERVPVQFEEVEKEVPVYEWECPDSLLKEEANRQ